VQSQTSSFCAISSFKLQAFVQCQASRFCTIPKFTLLYKLHSSGFCTISKFKLHHQKIEANRRLQVWGMKERVNWWCYKKALAWSS
jgi:hypothetical protein